MASPTFGRFHLGESTDTHSVRHLGLLGPGTISEGVKIDLHPLRRPGSYPVRPTPQPNAFPLEPSGL